MKFNLDIAADRAEHLADVTYKLSMAAEYDGTERGMTTYADLRLPDTLVAEISAYLSGTTWDADHCPGHESPRSSGAARFCKCIHCEPPLLFAR